MPVNKETYELDVSNAARALDELTARATRLRQELEQVASTLGSAATTDPAFRGKLREYAAVQGAASSVQSINASASSTGVAPGDRTLLGGMEYGANQAIKEMAQIPAGLGASAQVQAVQQVSAQAGAGYETPLNTRDYMRGIISSASSDITRTLVLPATRQFGGLNPIGGMEAAGGYSSAQLMGGDPTMMFTAQQAMMAGSAGGPFTTWGGGRFGQLAALPYARGAAVGIGGGAAALFSVSAGEAVSGHPDIMGGGAAVGALGGGVIGGLVGGPIGAAVGMGIGSQVGSWLAAPMERQAQMMAGLQNMQGTTGESLRALAAWSSTAAADINQRILGGSNLRSVSAQGMGYLWSSASAGLLAGGMDPSHPSGMGALPFPQMETMPGGSTSQRLFGGIETHTRNLSRVRAWAAAGAETMAETIARRVASLYPDDTAAAEVMGRVAPIYGTMPETGGNTADILARFGPTDTFRYLQTQTEPGGLVPYDVRQLARMSADVRSAGRDVTLGGLQARGSGAAMGAALRTQGAAIRRIPGGDTSIEYAENQASIRDAEALMFSQQSMVDYAIPMTRLQGVRSMLNVMPYSPGLRFGVDVLGAQMMRERQGAVTRYMEGRREAGQLSEAEELSLTQEITNLQVGRAQAVANLTEGVADRLPALSAGRPGFFSRLDSPALAAYNIMQTGHPRRSYGAIGGRQLRSQDAFVRSLLADPAELMPSSRGAFLPEGGSAGGQAASLLAQMVQLLQQIAGQGDRRGRKPGEATGAMAAEGSSKRGPGYGGWNQ